MTDTTLIPVPPGVLWLALGAGIHVLGRLG